MNCEAVSVVCYVAQPIGAREAAKDVPQMLNMHGYLYSTKPDVSSRYRGDRRGNMFRIAKQVQQQAISGTWCRQEHKQFLPLAIQEVGLKRIIHRSISKRIANWLHKSSLCNSCQPVSSASVLHTAKSCWKVMSQYLKSRHVRGGNTSICAHSDPDFYAHVQVVEHHLEE
ncbi:hypothetical protein IQ06DRAFT_311349 [Phaeosphaeriaceae sp. SRC1lsM3a]|nr:hypothetical protein IQ06DRAFT_311349 [Stagonospora sp. SRC1lsM3a]